MNPCRSVVNNPKYCQNRGIDGLARKVLTSVTCPDRIGILVKRQSAYRGQELYLPPNYGTGETSFVVLRKNGITSNEQAKEYQYTEGVADQPVVANGI